MSYNIDTWRTKVLEDLRIPFSAIHESMEKDDYITIEWLKKEDKVCIAGGSECLEIIGHKDGEDLVVEKITNYGSGSGNFHEDFLKEWLSKSSGKLEAVLVWEGGDSITRVTVAGGVVEEKEVEL